MILRNFICIQRNFREAGFQTYMVEKYIMLTKIVVIFWVPRIAVLMYFKVCCSYGDFYYNVVAWNKITYKIKPITEPEKLILLFLFLFFTIKGLLLDSFNSGQRKPIYLFIIYNRFVLFLKRSGQWFINCVYHTPKCIHLFTPPFSLSIKGDYRIIKQCNEGNYNVYKKFLTL